MAATPTPVLPPVDDLPGISADTTPDVAGNGGAPWMIGDDALLGSDRVTDQDVAATQGATGERADREAPRSRGSRRGAGLALGIIAIVAVVVAARTLLSLRSANDVRPIPSGTPPVVVVASPTSVAGGGSPTTSIPSLPPSVPPPSAAPSADWLFGDGSWRGTGSYPGGAVWAQGVALLADGRVFVVGGTSGPDSREAVATAALFDPTSSSWSSVAPMLEARTYPAVAVLQDGTVLVAGGARNQVPLATAERFDPRTGTWTSAGRMTVAHTDATASVLPDGRVLVAGGGMTARPYAATARTDLYDPASGTWSAGPPMSVARADQTATVLADGRVLVAGGATVYYALGQVHASAEIFDPQRNSWTTVASMDSARYTAAAVTINGGRQVLVAGGWDSTADLAPSLASAELYDVAGNTWTPVGSMSDGRGQFRMVLLTDGRALAVGGIDSTYNVLSSADLYDPGSQTWTGTGRTPVPVFWGALAALPDDSVLIAGGATDKNTIGETAATALYRPPAP